MDDATFEVNIIALPTVTITAKSCTRTYGDENPAFEYTVEGGTITGAPSLSCAATKTSPAGEYAITIERGTVDYPNVVLVNGTLTVSKATLTAAAKSYTRMQGEENPAFEIGYSGFKNGETADVLVKKPVAATTATAASEPGTYPITVSGGEAQNYDFDYVDGTLTVTPRPAANATLSASASEITAGGEGSLVVSLSNEGLVCNGYQFKVTLPQGVRLARGEDGDEFRYELSDRYTKRKNMQVTIQENGDGSYQVICFSLTNELITGTEGSVITLGLKADVDASPGQQQGKLTDIALSNEDGTSTLVDDATFEVNIITSLAEIIAEDVVIIQGKSSDLIINLNNPGIMVAAFQMDIHLPENVSVEKATLSDRWNEESMTFKFSKQTDSNTYRFMCYSIGGDILQDESGPLFTITIGVGDNSPVGNHTCKIDEIQLAARDNLGQIYGLDLPGTSFTFTVIDGIPITTVVSDDTQPTYNLQGIKMISPQRGIYIRNGKKMVVK